MTSIITEIVDKELCCSCGVCAGLCPADALSMEVRKNGDLAAKVDTERCIEKCHVCLDVCPLSDGVHNPRGENASLFSTQPNAKVHENIGWYTHTIVGFRSDHSLRNSNSSGGLATWCLEQLLREEAVTRVAVVRLAENQGNGFFEFQAATSVEELRQASGSVYHPIEISGIIKEILSSKNERWAIVGVPCLCAAVRNSHRLRAAVPFVFGLACGMYQNTFYTEMLLAESGVDRNTVVDIEYRRKSDGGPPSDFRFRGTDNRGHGKEVRYHGLPYFLGKNAFFRQNACNFCMDVFAETADACFMDAWLPAYRQGPKGTSLVVIRNHAVSELFNQGLSDDEISIEEIGPEQVVASQRGHVRRKQELIHMRRGMHSPDSTSEAKPTIVERMNWLLQQRAQTRSKKAWACWGRKFGQFAFWLAMADIVLMQHIVRNYAWAVSLPKRLAKKCKRLLPYGE